MIQSSRLGSLTSPYSATRKDIVSIFPACLRSHRYLALNSTGAVLARLRRQYSLSTCFYLKAVQNGEIAGYVVWDDPNSKEHHQLDVECPDLDIHLGGDPVLTAGIAKETAALHTEVESPHWTLSGLAVDPAFQRMGVGSLLLQWGLQRADEQSLPICLIASEEVRRMSQYQLVP